MREATVTRGRGRDVRALGVRNWEERRGHSRLLSPFHPWKGERRREGQCRGERGWRKETLALIFIYTILTCESCTYSFPNTLLGRSELGSEACEFRISMCNNYNACTRSGDAKKEVPFYSIFFLDHVWSSSRHITTLHAYMFVYAAPLVQLPSLLPPPSFHTYCSHVHWDDLTLNST